MSMGLSKSKSGSTSQDLGSDVWGGQQGYLKDIFANAQNQFNNGGNGFANAAYDQMGQYQQGIQGAMDTTQRLQNPGANPMMDMYAKQVGQNFNEQIMPALQGNAMMAGGFGGSRAKIGEGLAASRAGQQIQDFGAQLYNQDQDRALQAAGMQGTLGGLGSQMAQQQGAFGMSSPWYNMQQYAGLIGSPIMQDLGGTANSSSKSKSISGGLW